MTPPGETIADRDRRQGRSPQRRIRVPDDPYYQSVGRAKDELGTDVGEVVTYLLDRFLKGDFDDDFRDYLRH